MNRIFYDTEFIDNGKGELELLSIGLCKNNGQTYYAEVNGVDFRKADEWVRNNVFTHMRGPVKSRDQIAFDIFNFVGQEKPEFWAYFASWDWMLLCRLYGRMIDIPKHWPRWTHDICWIAQGADLPLQTSVKHHALNDALWVKDCYNYLTSLRNRELYA